MKEPMQNKIFIVFLVFLISACQTQSALPTLTLTPPPAVTSTSIPIPTATNAMNSGNGSANVQLLIENQSVETAKIYWINSNGKEIQYAALEPGDSFQQNTFSTHAWRIKDEANNIIGEFYVKTDATQIYRITAEQQVVKVEFSACQPTESAPYDGVSLAFPRKPDRIPSVGTVKGIVLFAEFPDVTTTMTPEEAFALISPGAEEYYKTVSYGRMDLQLEPYFTWLPLSKTSSEYAEGLHDFEGHRQFLQEPITLADANVDFTDADLVIVLSNPRASALVIGPAWTGRTDLNSLSADGVDIYNGTNSGYDLNNWGFLWLNHEMGHLMGLPDLYAIGESYNTTHRFVGGFGLMGNIGGNANEYFAYERWLLGWLDNDQVVCQESNNQTTTLTPIEIAGGTKAVMIPLKGSKVLVLESRRALGYDSKLGGEAGILIYTVNSAVVTGQGPIIVENNKALLSIGKSVTVDGVTITVIESTEEGDTVQVTK